LFDSIREIESSANVGETLGESEETFQLMMRPARGLQDLTKYVMDNHTDLLRKARPNNYRRIAKSLADLVLEYRFGVAPLIEDFKRVSETLPFRTLNEPRVVPIKGKGRSFSATMSKIGDYKLVAGDINGTEITFSNVSDFTVRYHGMYRMDPGIDYASYQQSLGLTWREALPTLANLTPYSFLLDYVSNFGSVLSQFAAPWGSVAWVNLTERASNSYTYEVQGRSTQPSFPPSFYTERYDKLGFYSCQAKAVQRRDATWFKPLVVLEWHKPSIRQLQNTGALLLSRLPVIGNLAAAARKRSPRLDPYVRSLLMRGSMQKVPYPYHR